MLLLFAFCTLPLSVHLFSANLLAQNDDPFTEGIKEGAIREKE